MADHRTDLDELKDLEELIERARQELRVAETSMEHAADTAFGQSCWSSVDSVRGKVAACIRALGDEVVAIREERLDLRREAIRDRLGSLG